MSTHLASRPLADFGLWEKARAGRTPLSFELEITARCNNNCRHCYINLPADDPAARQAELSAEEIERIAEEAAQMGALWCLLTGGEPLLRPDFAQIYLALRQKGLLVSVFTNACLVSEKHVRLFRRHPPRSIEVSVYGAGRKTYERVTRRPGSYAAFRRGLESLLAAGLPVTLKAMALRSNLHEMDRIAAFGRGFSRGPFRFDPFLHLRYDADPARNAEIAAERLSPEQIVALETGAPERVATLRKTCRQPAAASCEGAADGRLFRCGAGLQSFAVGWDGSFRLCASLCHPECTADLRRVSLAEAWRNLAPRVRALQSQRDDYLPRCARCPLINLCPWCPAHAHLECGALDAPVESFCRAARARARALEVSGAAGAEAGMRAGS